MKPLDDSPARARFRSTLTALPLPVLLGSLAIVVLAGSVLLSRHGGEKVDFNEDVRPILNANCIACHGGVKQAGGFSLIFREDALGPAESGRYAIVPGDPDASEMIRRITHHDVDVRMPLEKPPLSDADVETLRRWIEQGAQWEDHWAYVKPEPQPLPVVTNEEWPQNGIDHFVLARLEEEGLEPSPPAPCAVLIRRVSLDLVGLPPTPAEADRFCADPSAEAYRAVVDRLLESPRYGERWASMWMDLARYADTKGYERDPHRDIWRYRDWVITAFNEDLPFDRFTIQQLAGDLLPGATDEQVIATAFHRNTMTNDEGGTSDEEFRVAAVIDRVNTTWEVFQGTTMACTQCHTHTYDPFRHEEYYGILAFFNNSADADWNNENPRLVSYEPEDQQRVRTLLARLDSAGAQTPQLVTESLFERLERTLYPRGRIAASSFQASDEVGGENEFVSPKKDRAYVVYEGIDLTGVGAISIGYIPNSGGGSIEIRLGSPTGRMIGEARLAKYGEEQREHAVRAAVEPVAGKQDVYFVMRLSPGKFRYVWYSLHPIVADGDAERAAEVRRLQNELTSIDPEGSTPVMKELPEEHRRVTRVFERGNWLVLGDTVQPDVPESMPPLPPDAPRNRLGLARWLVSPENPLTARVTVNRFWAQIFGTGIVATLGDFGSQGDPPSHPALLDWLALRFMNEHDWSMKSLLREVVLSATYQQSSHVSAGLAERDPSNRLLARGPRVRLTAEQIRDQALAVSGLLSDKMLGPSVMPPQPPGLWNSPYSNVDWEISEGEDRYRRAVYTYWKRTVPYPSMLTFDLSSREVCLSRRIPTNTPLQALVTLNDPVYVVAAQALARRMVSAGESLDERVKAGFRMAMSREPDQATLEQLTGLYRLARDHYEDDPVLLEEAVEPYMPYAEDEVAQESPDNRNPLLRWASSAERSASQDLDVAALTTVATAILNLDGFLTKE